MKRLMHYLDNCRSCERITISTQRFYDWNSRNILGEYTISFFPLVYTVCVKFTYILIYFHIRALLYRKLLLLVNSSGKYTRNLKEFLLRIFSVIKISFFLVACYLFSWTFQRNIFFFLNFFFFHFWNPLFISHRCFVNFTLFIMSFGIFSQCYCNIFNDRLLSWKNNLVYNV